LFDPVERYVRKQGMGPSPPRARRAQPRPTAPLSAEAGHPPRVAEEPYRNGEELDTSSKASISAQPGYLEERARELVHSGTATIALTGGVLQARLIRFWNGSGVLAMEHSTPTVQGNSVTRLLRRQLAEPVPMLTNHLAVEVAELEADIAPG